MTEFLEFQSIVNYRVPVNDDGTLGSPQITNKWTRAIKEARKKKAAKKEPKTVKTNMTGEVEYL